MRSITKKALFLCILLGAVQAWADAGDNDAPPVNGKIKRTWSKVEAGLAKVINGVLGRGEALSLHLLHDPADGQTTDAYLSAGIRIHVLNSAEVGSDAEKQKAPSVITAEAPAQAQGKQVRPVWVKENYKLDPRVVDLLPGTGMIGSFGTYVSASAHVAFSVSYTRHYELEGSEKDASKLADTISKSAVAVNHTLKDPVKTRFSLTPFGLLPGESVETERRIEAGAAVGIGAGVFGPVADSKATKGLGAQVGIRYSRTVSPPFKIFPNYRGKAEVLRDGSVQVTLDNLSESTWGPFASAVVSVPIGRLRLRQGFAGAGIQAASSDIHSVTCTMSNTPEIGKLISEVLVSPSPERTHDLEAHGCKFQAKEIVESSRRTYATAGPIGTETRVTQSRVIAGTPGGVNTELASVTHQSKFFAHQNTQVIQVEAPEAEAEAKTGQGAEHITLDISLKDKAKRKNLGQALSSVRPFLAADQRAKIDAQIADLKSRKGEVISELHLDFKSEAIAKLGQNDPDSVMRFRQTWLGLQQGQSPDAASRKRLDEFVRSIQENAGGPPAMRTHALALAVEKLGKDLSPLATLLLVGTSGTPTLRVAVRAPDLNVESQEVPKQEVNATAPD